MTTISFGKVSNVLIYQIQKITFDISKKIIANFRMCFLLLGGVFQSFLESLYFTYIRAHGVVTSPMDCGNQHEPAAALCWNF